MYFFFNNVILHTLLRLLNERLVRCRNSRVGNNCAASSYLPSFMTIF